VFGGGGAEQALEAPTQVGRFADVRLGLRVVPAQKKNRRCVWDGSKEFSIVVRSELEAMGQHRTILRLV